MFLNNNLCKEVQVVCFIFLHYLSAKSKNLLTQICTKWLICHLKLYMQIQSKQTYVILKQLGANILWPYQ